VAERLRRIVHVDMDAFYASVEQHDDPALRGRPVAVGGDPRGRGVVCAASYEARAFGVRSAIPMARALRLCPSLVVVPARFSRYHEVSSRVFDLFRSVTPLVEPLSLDEAYLDVTDNAWGEPLGASVARRLKREILQRTGLTASAGVAPNKFLAKIASGWQKPDGLTIIAPERVERFLEKLPVDALWGVGPVTARKLHSLGISRLPDVRTASDEVLRRAVGNQSEWLRSLALGIDPRPVVPDRPRKSAGAERTYATDLADLEVIRRELERLARGTASWLARHHLAARTVTIKVRYGDFTTVTRSASEGLNTTDADALAARAVALLARTEAGSRPVRLLGVSVHNLVPDDAPPRSTQTVEGPRLPFPDPGADPSDSGT
jgi:DNA polymerase-4